jgi:hypothetical protein
MKTTILLLFWLGTAALLWAQADPKQPAPTRGSVLVLDDYRILEGDIERIGDQYRIKRQLGETWVPAAAHMRLCADRREAYRYLAAQANLVDPDERMRLARWCLIRGLRAEALAEGQAALRLAPKNQQIQHFVRELQRLPQTLPQDDPLQLVQHQVPVERPELPAEALGMFINKVQPILMNACVRCHINGRGGDFDLMRATQGAADSRAVRHNLTVVLKYIDRNAPHDSELLVKAANIHGGMDLPPLRGKQSAAYQTLEAWVRLATATPTANRPTLQPVAPPVLVPTPSSASPESGVNPPSVVSPPSQFGTLQPSPTPTNQPMDVNDPSEFNRQSK